MTQQETPLISKLQEPLMGRFDRREFAGSLGDLGTLLPISMGLIMVCGLSATAVFVLVGLYYILSGLYFKLTVPVQPMKVIGAYAIARGLSPVEISTAGFLVGVILLLLAATGVMTIVGRLVPKTTVRGVQLTTGMLLLAEGVRFILGESSFQKAQSSAEPFLDLPSLGPIPVGMLLGIASIGLILFLMDNRRTPAALIVVGAGAVVGAVLGSINPLAGMTVSFNLPSLLPHGLPETGEIINILLILALPQIPMTIGNAVVAQADLTKKYYGNEISKRSSHRALAVSMGIANLVGFLFGGMPMCHGAGGLAAHMRFGARTFGSNLMIGTIFVLVGFLLGDQAIRLLGLIPFAVLGAMLVFAGAELALTILDLKERRDLFVAICMLAVALATNLAVGFVVGIALAYLLKLERIRI